MSRSTTNWIFVVPLIAIVLWLVPPNLTGGTERTDMMVDLAGLFLILVGMAIRIVARDWKSAHLKYGLVTTGPYSVVRHPMYVGSFLTGIGLCLILGNLYFGIAFSVVYIILHAIVAKKEQRFLMKEWPEDFKNYKAQVPAYFPSPITVIKKLLVRKPWVTSKKGAILRELGTICGFLFGAVVLELRETLRNMHSIPQPDSHMHICMGLLGAIVLVWLYFTIKRPDRAYKIS